MRRKYSEKRSELNESVSQLKRGLRSVRDSIRADFYEVRTHFTVRAFFSLLFGAALLAACWYLFLVPVIYAFKYCSLIGTLLQLIFGVVGFLFSNILIVLLSVHSAASYPLGEAPQDGGDGVQTILSDALETTGKGRAKKIAVALAVYFLIFAAGFTALGFYIRDEVRYQNYAQAEAVIDLAYSVGDDGYTVRYKYTVDGVTYEHTGTSRYSGSAAPQKGDTIIIKYDPANPEKVYVQNESPALIFAVFLLGAGLLIVFAELYKRKIMPVQFLLVICMWLIPAVTFVAIGAFQPGGGFIEVLARTLALQIVLVFVYGGALELLNGILLLGSGKRGRKKSRKK